jgi:hypothetical protein
MEINSSLSGDFGEGMIYIWEKCTIKVIRNY